MLRVDRPAVIGGHLLDDDAATNGIGRRRERRQPAIGEAAGAPQLGIGDTTEPHVDRLLQRLRQHTEIVVVKALAVVRERARCPRPAQHGERLVEDRRPLGAGDPERLLLVWIGDAEPERRQQATTRQLVDRRQLLGEHDRIAARQHEHAHPELEVRRTTGGEGDRRHRLGRRGPDPLAEPQAVESKPLECVDDVAERRSVQLRPDPEPESHADLHGVGVSSSSRVDGAGV